MIKKTGRLALYVRVMCMLLFNASVFAAAPATLTQSVTYNSETITMQLTKENLRGSNFELLVQNSSGGYDAITPVEERSYIGTVDEYPGAVSCGILKGDGSFWGAVHFDRGVTWFTLDNAVNGTRALAYGVSDFSGFGMPTAPTVSPGQAGTTMYGFEVGLDADYDFYNTTASGNVDTAFEMIEHSVSLVRALYMHDLLLRPYMGRVIIRADLGQNPYTGTSEIPYHQATTAEWSTNQTDSNHDVVASFSPTKIGGGFGWVGVIGEINGTSVNHANADGMFYTFWRHEMGHNWGCNHYEGGNPEGNGIMGGNTPARFSGCEAYKVFNERDEKLAFLDNEGTYTAIDLPPYASLDAASAIIWGSSVTIDIMANDYDANADSLSLQSYDSFSSRGIPVALSAGTGPDGRDELIYEAAPALGTDHFLYTVVDSSGQTATGVVLIETTVPFTDYQAEDAVYSGAVFSDNNSGYTGTGFIDYKNSLSDYIEWTISIPADGIYTLNWRYALSSGDRPLEVKIDGLVVDPSMSFPSTNSWSAWGYTADLTIDLTAGTHTVRTTAIGSSGANIDLLRVYEGLNLADIDAYVRAGTNANTNYGSAVTLAVKSSGEDSYYTRESYLRFNHSLGEPDPIQSANLILTPSYLEDDDDTTVITVRLLDDADDGWVENEITYNNRPQGTGLEVTFTKGQLQVGVPFDIDVTLLLNQAMNANKVASFQIVNNPGPGGHVGFHSQEAATDVPKSEIITFMPGDVNEDGFVNLVDFAMFAEHWADMDCSDGIPTPCGRANIDGDNDVDMDDLLELAGDWLQ